MARLHLLEIHEQPWCPPPVRDGTTDILNVIARWGRQYERVVPLLQETLSRSRARRVIDLCSGSGGPWLQLYSRFGASSGEAIEIWLTDLYPNLPAMAAAAKQAHGQIHYVKEPVDVTRLPPELDGFRTLFTSFHHFPPDLARRILQDAVDHKQGIAIFEQTQRSVLGLLMMLTLPLIALVAVPFIRPFRLSRLFWTYIVPAIPLVLLHDGIVSCLRTYTAAEMEALIAGLHGAAFSWQIGRVSSPLSPLGIFYTIGWPDVQAETGDAAGMRPRVAVMK